MALLKRIPIRVHPLFWVFAILLSWLSTQSLIGTIIWTAIIFFSVLFHELGHALTAQLFGQEASIQLVIFGGLTLRTGPALSLWKEFLVILNGPLCGFILAAAAWIIEALVGPFQGVTQSVFELVFIVNIFWSCFNLVPVLPLDGGHLLRIVMEAIFGWRGVRISLMIGMILGAALTALCFVIQAFLPGALLLLMTFESYRAWRSAQLMAEPDRNESLQRLYHKAEEAMEKGDTLEAIETLQQVRQNAGKGVLYVTATQALAGVLSQQKQKQEAYTLLKEVRAHLSPEILLLFQQLAYDAGDYQVVVEISSDCYQTAPSFEVAVINALAHAKRLEVEPTIGWLQCARRDGVPDFDRLIQRPEFEFVRAKIT